MNLRDLEYVVALADKRHFGRAAKACHVSQPALSAQIKKLEDELGVQLFKRTPGDVMATEAARPMIANAKIILEKAAEIKKHAHFISQGQRANILNLGVIPTIAPYYLPRFFKTMLRPAKNLNIRWQIREEKTDALMQMLDDGRIDVAIMVIPASGTAHPNKILFDEPLLVAVPTGHRLARKKYAVLEDLRAEEWLLLDDGHCLNISMLDVCERAQTNVSQHSFRATSLETLRHMVASRSGITLMPQMARRANDGIVYIPFKDPAQYQRRVSIVWRRDSLDAASQLSNLSKQRNYVYY